MERRTKEQYSMTIKISKRATSIHSTSIPASCSIKKKWNKSLTSSLEKLIFFPWQVLSKKSENSSIQIHFYWHVIHQSMNNIFIYMTDYWREKRRNRKWGLYSHFGGNRARAGVPAAQHFHCQLPFSNCPWFVSAICQKLKMGESIFVSDKMSCVLWAKTKNLPRSLTSTKARIKVGVSVLVCALQFLLSSCCCCGLWERICQWQIVMLLTSLLLMST